MLKNHFSNLKREGKLKEETMQRASISIGGYLGEVVRRQIGGTWIAKNPVMKVLVINGEEFSPFMFFEQAATKDIDYSLQRYYSDVNNKRLKTAHEKTEDKSTISETPKQTGNSLGGQNQIWNRHYNGLCFY